MSGRLDSAIGTVVPEKVTMSVYYEKHTRKYVARFDVRIGSFNSRAEAEEADDYAEQLAKDFLEKLRKVYPQYERRD